MSILDATLAALPKRLISDPTTPQSAAEEAYRQFMRREISAADYMAMTAVCTSEAMHQYPVRLYPTPPPLVSRYITERGEGRREFDSQIGVALGIWLAGVRMNIEQNEADQSYLRWAEEKLKGVGFTDRAVRCAARAELYESHPIPALYVTGLRVQTMDSRSSAMNMSTPPRRSA